MRAIAAGVIISAGCFSKPERPGASTDGAPLVDAPPCVAPTISDNFDDSFAPPCGVGFGGGGGGGSESRGGGVLHMVPSPGVVSDGSCTWASFDFTDGAFVELRRPVNPGGSFTVLQVTVGAESVGIGVENDVETNLVAFETAGQLASTPYDPVAMRWLRVRPAAAQVALDYSADGRSWTAFAVTVVTQAPTTTIEVSLNGGIYNPVADPGEAEFDNFDVCP